MADNFTEKINQKITELRRIIGEGPEMGKGYLPIKQNMKATELEAVDQFNALVAKYVLFKDIEEKLKDFTNDQDENNAEELLLSSPFAQLVINDRALVKELKRLAKNLLAEALPLLENEIINFKAPAK